MLEVIKNRVDGILTNEVLKLGSNLTQEEIQDKYMKYVLTKLGEEEKRDIFAKPLRAIVTIDNNQYIISPKEGINIFNGSKELSNLSCPVCGNKLIYCHGKIREKYFRHDKNIDGDCMLLAKELYSKEEKRRSKRRSRIAETLQHIKLKNVIVDRINSNGLFLDINNKTYSLINAVKEKKVLNKDNETHGYKPDITAYTTTGEEIYIEVTVTSGKNEINYRDIWSRLDKLVLEVYIGDNKGLLDNFNSKIRVGVINYPKCMDRIINKIKNSNELILSNEGHIIRLISNPTNNNGKYSFKGYYSNKEYVFQSTNRKVYEELNKLYKECGPIGSQYYPITIYGHSNDIMNVEVDYSIKDKPIKFCIAGNLINGNIAMLGVNNRKSSLFRIEDKNGYRYQLKTSDSNIACRLWRILKHRDIKHVYVKGLLDKSFYFDNTLKLGEVEVINIIK